MINTLLTFTIGITLISLIIIWYLNHVNKRLKHDLNDTKKQNKALNEALNAVNQRNKIEQDVNGLSDDAVTDGLQSDYRD